MKSTLLSGGLLVTWVFTCAVHCADWRWNPQKPGTTESHVKVYLFNVKNPGQVLQFQKAEVEEVGPYVYKELVERVNITVNATQGSVKYHERRSYHFEPQLSDGAETDMVNFVNVPYGSGLGTLASIPGGFGASLIPHITNSSERLVKEASQVRDILFDGLDASVYAKLMAQFGEKPPPQMAEGRFGLFRGKNGTTAEAIEVDQCANFLHSIGDVVTWNKKAELKFWGSKACNKIRGTDGTVFAPDVTKDETLYFFNPEVCRSLPVVYHSDVEFKGVQGYRFTFPDSMLESPEENEANRCYCNGYDGFDEPDDFDMCYKTGILDVSSCRKNAPLAYSFPHFYKADQSYLNGVSGLEPNEEAHTSFIDIEPKTGTVLRSSWKLQLNLGTKPLKSISGLEMLSEYLFPVMWVDKFYEIPDLAAARLKEEKDNPELKNLADPDIDDKDGAAGLQMLSFTILMFMALAACFVS